MASAEIISNLKLITSGTIPTTSNLANGELAFGLVGGVAKLYGNVNGTIMDFSNFLRTAPVMSVNSKTGVVNLQASDVGAIPTTEKGVANGVAELDENGKVPLLQLPEISSGGGGALSEEQVYLYDYDWQDMGGTYEATKYISGIDYDSMIWYSADLNSIEAFTEAGVVMTEQSSGQVTFGCKEKPQNQIAVIVRWAK